MLHQRLEKIHFFLERLVALEELAGFVIAALRNLEIAEDQFEVDGFDVAQGIDRALHMHDIAGIEAADHMDDGVDLADMRQELVAQALALGRALDQSGDVDELDGGGGELVGLVHLRELVQPRVGDRNHADVGLDGTERIVGGLGAGVGDGVEQRGLSDVGQSDDS